MKDHLSTPALFSTCISMALSKQKHNEQIKYNWNFVIHSIKVFGSECVVVWKPKLLTYCLVSCFLFLVFLFLHFVLFLKSTKFSNKFETSKRPTRIQKEKNGLSIFEGGSHVGLVGDIDTHAHRPNRNEPCVKTQYYNGDGGNDTPSQTHTQTHILVP